MTTSNSKLFVTIDDKVYDLTVFKDFHPGGRYILEQYHEKDATDVFHAFHGVAGYAKLAKMKGVPVQNPPQTPDTILAYRKLRQKLVDDGFFTPHPLKQLFIVSHTLGIFFAGIILTLYGHWFIGAILVGIGSQQLGWLAHDTLHHGLTPWRKVNNFLGYIFGNAFGGFSAHWWKDRHNSHHAITNVLDSDPDLDNLPLFVWSKFDLRRVGTQECPGGKMAENIIPYQHLYFVPWTVTLKLIWNFQSINFVAHPELYNSAYRRVLIWERLSLFLHYLGIFFILCMTPSFFAGLFYFIVSEFIGGAAIALIVFMNHYACEHLKKEFRKEADFLTLQLTTTKNIDSGVFMDWFAGGLNYQIEHHLFPTMPRHNLSKVKPIVEQFCKEHNLPYVSQTWSDCLSAVEMRLAEVAQIYSKSQP